MSLKDDIICTTSKIKSSFHMPAHKYSDIFDIDISKLDTTEIEGTDNLHSAFSCIKNAEDRIAGIYGAKKSRLLVSGSSVGIISSIYALSQISEKILIGRDSHKSVFNACKIAKLPYVNIMPSLSQNGLPLDYENFYDELMANPDIKLALITSPTYYGHIRDFRKIASELSNRGGVLIVDEAHGAHLEFTDLKEHSALSQGAHIVIQSAHKTLPAMTMSAMLHYSNNLDGKFISAVDEALTMFQSTSPSYPLMISTDMAVNYMDKNRDMVQKKLEEFRKIEKDFFSSSITENRLVKDPFKIFVDTISIGYSGYEINTMLMKNGIYPEFAQYNGVLLYLSIFNEIGEIYDTFEFLQGLEKRTALPYKNLIYAISSKNSIKYGNINTKCEIINIDMSLGRVVMENIIPYPPGIPIVLAGENITEDVLFSLKQLSDFPIGTIEGKDEVLSKIKVESLD